MELAYLGAAIGAGLGAIGAGLGIARYEDTFPAILEATLRR